ncbi:MAG: thioredoxin family protein [Methanomassiliicoccales archaeon]|nr:thioredoxin family protein [Methanomassiliicoccales archaeon]
MSLAPLQYPIALMEKAPPFEKLKGVDGKEYSSPSFDGDKILVLIFIANRCPTARVYTDRMNAIQRDYGPRGVQIVAVNSDSQYLFSTEAYSEMVKISQERGFSFPYLKDEDQKLAKSFGALVTLHAFVLDEERRFRYRGRIDDSRDPELVTTNDLRNALDDLLENRQVRVPETRPFACAIELFGPCVSCGDQLGSPPP